MLGIFLGILKWLGILLLVLLGLVLTVLLAVLFLPVRYEAEGSFRGELLAKGQISWLWRLFSIQAVYDGDTEVSLRIFGVKPGRKKETAERTEKNGDSRSCGDRKREAPGGRSAGIRKSPQGRGTGE